MSVAIQWNRKSPESRKLKLSVNLPGMTLSLDTRQPSDVILPGWKRNKRFFFDFRKKLENMHYGFQYFDSGQLRKTVDLFKFLPRKHSRFNVKPTSIASLIQTSLKSDAETTICRLLWAKASQQPLSSGWHTPGRWPAYMEKSLYELETELWRCQTSKIWW